MQIEEVEKSEISKWKKLRFCYTIEVNKGGKGGVNKGYVDDAWDAVENNEKKALVATHDGKRVGFVIFDHSSPIPSIHKRHICIDLICATKVKGIPVGQKLMRSVFKWVLNVQHAPKLIVLEAAGTNTYRNANEEERRLSCWYGMLGFKKTEYQNVRDPLMTKTVTKKDLDENSLSNCRFLTRKCLPMFPMCERKHKPKRKVHNTLTDTERKPKNSVHKEEQKEELTVTEHKPKNIIRKEQITKTERKSTKKVREKKTNRVQCTANTIRKKRCLNDMPTSYGTNCCWQHTRMKKC